MCANSLQADGVKSAENVISSDWNALKTCHYSTRGAGPLRQNGLRTVPLAGHLIR